MATTGPMIDALEMIHIVLSNDTELEDVGASFIRERHLRMVRKSPGGAAMVVALAAHDLASRGGDGILTFTGAMTALDAAYAAYKTSCLPRYAA